MSCESVMKTWVWVLLLATAVLFLWTVQRERFQSTNTLHGPPYGGCTTYKADGTCDGPDDYAAIVGMMPATLVVALKAKNQAGVAPVEPLSTATTAEVASYQSELKAYQKKLVDGIISDTMGEFYTKAYQPAVVALTAAKVDTFMGTYLAQIRTTSPSVFTFLTANKADVTALLVAYFVTQAHGEQNGPLLGRGATAEQQAEALAAAVRSANASTASGYDSLLASGGQDPCKKEVATMSWDKVSEACKKSVAGTSDEPADKTTGNSSLTSGSTAGGPAGVQKGNIWGPAYVGMGDNAGGGAGGSGTRDYPTLLGPKPKESIMVEGAGIAPVSINRPLGGLPSGGSTGSNEDSRFFGTSRLPGTGASTIPGDQDLYPGAFTASTGSSKTEPIPFLADFSAFLR